MVLAVLNSSRNILNLSYLPKLSRLTDRLSAAASLESRVCEQSFLRISTSVVLNGLRFLRLDSEPFLRITFKKLLFADDEPLERRSVENNH